MMKRLYTIGMLAALSTVAVAQEPVGMEYFYDSDPGHGKATPVSGVTTGSNTLQLSTDGLQNGAHQLGLRCQDSRGLWSATMNRSVYVLNVRPTTPTVMEYFLDTDPGYGRGMQMSVSEGENRLALDLSGAAYGPHLLGLRSLDDSGNWSATMSRALYVCEPRGLVALEYYFDNDDPGEGKAKKVEVPEEWDKAFSFEVDIDRLATGDHHLCVRGKDRGGLWTEVSREPFCIQTPTDIREVRLTMPVSITAGQSCVTIAEAEGCQRGDCLIEVVTVDGAAMAAASWKRGVRQISLPIATGNVLIVKLTDKENGRRVVRRIVCK